jgi:hypothetical protein
LWEHNCKAHNIEYSSDSTDLEVNLSCDKTEFIQGESIDVLVKIRNTTKDTISITPKHHLNYYHTDSTFSNGERGAIIIPPSENYYYMIDPSDWLFFMGRMDLTTFSLKPGNYEYYMSASLNNEKYLSNKLNIKVNPVPDTLQQIFNELKYEKNKMYNVDTDEILLTKYKDSFYAENFYIRVLNYDDYYRKKDGGRHYDERVIKLIKEFILKFPNNSHTTGYFNILLNNYSDNQVTIEEILKSLKQNKPDCKLLEVLRNQPDDLYKQIKHLLN